MFFKLWVSIYDINSVDHTDALTRKNKTRKKRKHKPAPQIKIKIKILFYECFVVLAHNVKCLSYCRSWAKIFENHVRHRGDYCISRHEVQTWPTSSLNYPQDLYSARFFSVTPRPHSGLHSKMCPLLHAT